MWRSRAAARWNVSIGFLARQDELSEPGKRTNQASQANGVTRRPTRQQSPWIPKITKTSEKRPTKHHNMISRSVRGETGKRANHASQANWATRRTRRTDFPIDYMLASSLFPALVRILLSLLLGHTSRIQYPPDIRNEPGMDKNSELQQPPWDPCGKEGIIENRQT